MGEVDQGRGGEGAREQEKTGRRTNREGDHGDRQTDITDRKIKADGQGGHWRLWGCPRQPSPRKDSKVYVVDESRVH